MLNMLRIEDIETLRHVLNAMKRADAVVAEKAALYKTCHFNALRMRWIS